MKVATLTAHAIRWTDAINGHPDTSAPFLAPTRCIAFIKDGSIVRIHDPHDQAHVVESNPQALKVLGKYWI